MYTFSIPSVMLDRPVWAVRGMVFLNYSIGNFAEEFAEEGIFELQ
jgi:hypothetical protein